MKDLNQLNAQGIGSTDLLTIARVVIGDVEKFGFNFAVLQRQFFVVGFSEKPAHLLYPYSVPFYWPRSG